ncbi:MAG: hypothetical protein JNM18_18285 [Planctomycetaceae bacterium]|nr:hypothetical protein [Planctomycetaceae bacterium]
MKHSLPIFSIVLLAGFALVFKDAFVPVRGYAAPENLPAVPAPPAAPPAAPVRVASGLQPLEVLKAAYEKVDHYGSISAKLRQRAELFGVSMLGTGTYIQGSSPSHRLRYEVTMQLGNRKASVQQIADGEYLWTRRELASAPTLTRVNIDRVLEIQEAHRGQTALRSGYVLGLGGLTRVLLSLQTCWTFDTVAETTHGGMPMYVLRGTWNRDSLTHLLQDQKDAIRKGATPDITKLAEQVPDEVLVFLGRDDLFPYRFEYRRTPASPPAGEGSRAALRVG